MRTVQLQNGEVVPVLGQGTWGMGNHHGNRRKEVAALQRGIDLGMNLIDTAEMYADGGAEEVVGAAIDGRRDHVYVVSKVLPQNASRRGTITAAEQSLKRLRIERIDLYLFHRIGPHPLQETLEAFAELQLAGRIGGNGVSNFDRTALLGALRLRHGEGILANQVLYNLGKRGIDHGLLPESRSCGIVTMAYSPLHQGQLRPQAALREVARRHGVTPEQVALAWTIRGERVLALVKASREEHVRQNAAAAELRLDDDDLRQLDAAYPPPAQEVPLEML